MQATTNHQAPLDIGALVHRNGQAGRITQSTPCGFTGWAYVIEWAGLPTSTTLVMDFEVQPVRPFTAINGGRA